MKPELELLTGKWWVPTETIDVGPFDTEAEANDHIKMIENARQSLAREKHANGY